MRIVPAAFRVAPLEWPLDCPQLERVQNGCTHPSGEQCTAALRTTSSALHLYWTQRRTVWCIDLLFWSPNGYMLASINIWTLRACCIECRISQCQCLDLEIGFYAGRSLHSFFATPNGTRTIQESFENLQTLQYPPRC